MPPIVQTSTSDFMIIREERGLYVDRSRFISEVLARGAQAQLYPRPRRFGKTTSMSILCYFLEIGPDRTQHFEDLVV